jgi:hypothetical protein
LLNWVDDPDEPSSSAAILLWLQLAGSKVKKLEKGGQCEGQRPLRIFMKKGTCILTKSRVGASLG